MLYRVVERLRRLLCDRHGQDMVEYALLAGFLAVSAGALLPNISDPMGTIWAKVSGLLSPECQGAPGNAESNGCGPAETPSGHQ